LLVACFVQVDVHVTQVAALLVGVATLASALLPWAMLAEGTSSEPAMRSAAILLKQNYGRLLFVRTAFAVALTLGVAYWTFTHGAAPPVPLALLGFGLAAAIEVIGRYLFFRCVVPRNMPLNFFAGKPAH
jgi:DMSO reductase anchor subunit